MIDTLAAQLEAILHAVLDAQPGADGRPDEAAQALVHGILGQGDEEEDEDEEFADPDDADADVPVRQAREPDLGDPAILASTMAYLRSLGYDDAAVKAAIAEAREELGRG